MTTLTYNGFIKEDNYGENDDALFIGDSEEPIAEILEDEIVGKQVSARYWIADKETTKEQLQEDFIRTISGIGDAEYTSRYSDITGYLWTDEELKIGGHDLLEEIRSYLGKFIYLEIDVHN